MGSTIAVGVDNSPAARTAADWAALRAQRLGVDVLLVRVQPDAGERRGQHSSSAAFDMAARALEDERERISTVVPRSTIHTTIRRGEIAQVLAELSSETSMVVVGMDKTGSGHGEGFGVAALELAAQSACTVAIIPGTLPKGAGVVVGVDGTPEAEWALRVAAGEAVMAGEPLTIVHAAQVANDGEQVIGRAEDSVRARHPRLEILTVLDIRHGAALALAEASGNARLLVVGSRGRGHAKAMRPDAISAVVLARIPVPMMVTKGKPGTRLVSGAGR